MNRVRRPKQIRTKAFSSNRELISQSLKQAINRFVMSREPLGQKEINATKKILIPSFPDSRSYHFTALLVRQARRGSLTKAIPLA